MSQYYHHVRSDIRKLLPPEARRILELGAGAGRTGRWLKRFYTDAEVVAIEINPELEPELKENVDRTVIGSVDHHLDTLGKFDLVLALDVLEHLPDPQKTLSRVRDALLPGGRRHHLGSQRRPLFRLAAAVAAPPLPLRGGRNPGPDTSAVLR